MELEIKEFLSYMKQVKNASDNTIDSYRNDLEKLQAFLSELQITSIDKMNETCLTSYMLNLEKEGCQPSTIARNLASIRSFVFYLIRHQKLTFDPTERLHAPKVERKAPACLTTEEIQRLLESPSENTPKDLRDRAMLELLYATGIRVTELIGLTVDDMNLKNRYVCCRGEGIHKSRLVPFGHPAAKALETYIKDGRPQLMKEENNFLFLNRNGNQMSRQGFWKLMKAYAQNAGIKEMNPSILRNTFAIHMVNNGADLRSIQELLGHADIGTTQIYSRQRNGKVLEVYQQTHPRA